MVLKGSYDVIPEFRLTHADGTRNDNAVFATVLVELSEIIGDISSEVSRLNVRTRNGADYEITVLRALTVLRLPLPASQVPRLHNLEISWKCLRELSRRVN